MADRPASSAQATRPTRVASATVAVTGPDRRPPWSAVHRSVRPSSPEAPAPEPRPAPGPAPAAALTTTLPPPAPPVAPLVPPPAAAWVPPDAGPAAPVPAPRGPWRTPEVPTPATGAWQAPDGPSAHHPDRSVAPAPERPATGAVLSGDGSDETGWAGSELPGRGRHAAPPPRAERWAATGVALSIASMLISLLALVLLST